ncbi:MAG: hypothetical protein ACKOL0_01470 [Solirubrobacterales bacterium]
MTGALSPADFPFLTGIVPVILLVILIAAAILFTRSGKALRDLGGGRWAIDREDGSESGGPVGPELDPEAREEVRQMVEARDYRLRRRGADGIDVEAEVTRLTSVERDPDGRVAAWTVEIRQLVIANNERRKRRGEQPLDVEAEVARRLAEWT